MTNIYTSKRGHYWFRSLHWHHNDHDGVSNHQPHGCLLNRLFRRRSKKTLKLRVTGLCVGNSPGPVNSPHKGLVTRKMFSFDDVIMDGLLGFFWRQANIWKTKNKQESAGLLPIRLMRTNFIEILFNVHISRGFNLQCNCKMLISWVAKIY